MVDASQVMLVPGEHPPVQMALRPGKAPPAARPPWRAACPSAENPDS